jgi:hypothetical protein
MLRVIVGLMRTSISVVSAVKVSGRTVLHVVGWCFGEVPPRVVPSVVGRPWISQHKDCM